MKVKKFQGGFTQPGDTYLGIDQSYTGFGVTAIRGEEYVSRLYVLPDKGVYRLLNAQYLLHLLVTEFSPGVLAMEGYAHAAKFGAAQAGELGAAIKLGWTDYRLEEPLVVPPSSLKKYASGKGNATKDVVLLSVYKNFGVEFDDNNMADSYVIAKIAAGHATNQIQRDIVAAVRKEQKQ